MVIFNNERMLEVSKEKWESSGKQQLEDMTIRDLEKHKELLRKRLNNLRNEMESNVICTSGNDLSNVNEARKIIGYLVLLGKKSNELMEVK